MNRTQSKSKHSREVSAAKKLFFTVILLLPLWGLGSCLLAQSCVSVRQVSTNYATKQITFDLTWGTCNNTNHLYRVWVFVDYQPVTGLTKGAWSRAAITGSSAGALHNNAGVWVTGTAGATQRVTLTLAGVPAQFNWCAVATDCPPNATLSNGTYTLKGSPPFVINGSTTVSAKTYTGSITTITDATKNPEWFVMFNVPTCTTDIIYLGAVGFTSSKTWVVGSQTWSAPVTATYCNKTSFNGGTSSSYKADCRTNSTIDYGHLFSWCMVVRFKTTLCPNGWRVPTKDEFLTLDKTLGGTGTHGQDNITLRNKYLSTWGGQYGGYAHSGSLGNQGSHANYWMQSEHSTDDGYLLSFEIIGTVYPQNYYYKNLGFSLRCIK